MYTRFFGLGQAPFSIAPDPRYVFMSERHREALAHLLYGLDGGGGFVLLTGEIGAGKTTVCRLFLERIPAHCNVAYIFNPKQTVTELLQSICDEFGVPVEREAGRPATVKDFIDPLNIYLLATHASHRNNVLIIDEAQNLSADVLEQLRLLTNLETNERKLLQIILIGQPELRAMLAAPELEQLAQRIIARCHLGALSAEETGQYIAHRLAVAGIGGNLPFGGRAMRRIHRHARGVPRRINLLCDRALLGAYARNRREADARIIDAAAKEVFGVEPVASSASAAPWRHAAAGLLAGVLILGGAAFALDWHGGLRKPIAGATPAASMATPAQPIRVAMAPAASAAAPVASPLPAAPSASTSSSSPLPAPSSSSSASPSPSSPSSPPASSATPADAPEPTASPQLDGDVRDLQATYRRLGRLWQIELNGGEPCAAAEKQNVYCFAGGEGLAGIRQLDRPVILTLHDDQGMNYYALLMGLSGDSALLRLGDVTENVSLNALARRWRGEFATLWRAPAGYRRPLRKGDRGAAVDWLAAQVGATGDAAKPPAGRAYDDALAARVREFQLAHGLRPDGIAGPQTFMQLASAAGPAEPRLRHDAAVTAAPPGK
ncbi:MAG: AAA family ATPase [Burkholderiaceae bacterium]